LVSFSDISNVVSAAFDIEKAKGTVVSVLLMIDESSSKAFQSFVRTGFASNAENARLMVTYFPTMDVNPDIDVDLVVIAAGEGSGVGKLAVDFQQKERPVLIIAESAPTVRQVALAEGIELNPECIVAPSIDQSFDESIHGDLADTIGRWIADSVPQDKHLAFSIAYPFVRRPLAYDIINATAAQNAGVGAIVFVPGADMPIMTVNQMKMVLEIAAAYNQPIDIARAKELAAVLGGAFVFRTIARNIVGLVPVGGWAVKGAMGFAGTQAIGHAALEYFDNGGDIAGLSAVVGEVVEKTAETAETVSKQPVTQVLLDRVGPAIGKAANSAGKQILPVLNGIAKAAFDAKKPGAKKAGK
jgi:uncharacterized protein (DUF697 family)